MVYRRIELDVAELSGAALEAALLSLAEKHELNFYDSAFPSVSDPGAYVKIKREDQHYYMYRGNHGWSSGWKLETAEAILAYMLECQQNNRKSRP